jgi:hypothetical protein
MQSRPTWMIYDHSANMHVCLTSSELLNVTDWGWNIPRLMSYTINMIPRHQWSWTYGWVTCSPRHGTPLYSPTQFSSHFHQLSSNTQLPITNQVLKPSISTQWTLSAVTTLNSHQPLPLDKDHTHPSTQSTPKPAAGPK